MILDAVLSHSMDDKTAVIVWSRDSEYLQWKT